MERSELSGGDPGRSPLFPWRICCATAAIALIFFSFTLTSAVPVWVDESFIVEYGRVALAGGEPVFGFHQRSDSHRPMYLYTLLGGILPELAFRATAPSNLGPRVAALLGQIAAFAWLIYYVRLRGLSITFSVLLGLAFLLDPLCDIGWRGGRVDGWSFAFLFASLSAIRTARGQPRGNRAWTAAFLGGVAAAAGFLCWPSFTMFSPLILLELGGVRQPGYSFRICSFAAGGLLAAAAVTLPFRREFMFGLADAHLLTVLQAKMTRGDGFGEQFQALLWSLAQTPIVVVAGLCALARKHNRLLLAGFLVALVFTFGTKVYRLRILYLLPYLYLAIASLFYRLGERPARFLGHPAGVWAVALMLFAGAGFTVAGTTLSGLSGRSGKNPLDLIEPARSAVGSGPVRVFMQEPDLYFAGRALGWQQFYCFDGCWGPGIPTQTFRGMLAAADVAIYRGEPDPLTRSVIQGLGFRFATVLFPGGGHQSNLLGWSYGPRSYGPYFIYRRTQP
jgi:hypothetical protein